MDSQRQFFNSQATLSFEFRIEQLRKLEAMILNHGEQFVFAMQKDFRKPAHETWISEIGVLLHEIRFAIKNLKKWMRPQRAGTGALLFPSRGRLVHEPRGVTLIIGPWNYPVQLVISPLVGAIAAGCTAVLKPSELAPNTSHLIAKLIKETYPTNYVTVVEGGPTEATALLTQKFDMIFFTGSTTVGKFVAKAAADNLIPVTLELGGKSPTVVDTTADLTLAARRIIWGKIFNCGQTCVAPDYILAEESVAQTLISKMKDEILRQLGPHAQRSSDFGRIINAKHHQRIRNLISPAQVFYGGGYDAQDLYLQPTILFPVKWTDAVMQEEIFGPLIPVLPFRDFSQVLEQIRNRPKPLAAYIFSSSKERIAEFLQIASGNACVNDVLAQFGSPTLPVGGVGESGMGRYHGRASFETFSHCKSILYRTGWFDLSVRYGPYTDFKTRFIRRLTRS